LNGGFPAIAPGAGWFAPGAIAAAGVRKGMPALSIQEVQYD
jgi:hypothetical protein